MSDKAKYNILLVDDHTMILEGVSRVINESKEFEVTQMVTSVSKALQILQSNNLPMNIIFYLSTFIRE